MKKVLLVEDSIFQADKIRIDLEASGFEVEVSYDGTTALRKVGQWLPDVIVLDYLLPDINGIEICRTLKQNPLYRTIPIVVFSVESKLGNMTMAYSAGADNYVVKGYDETNVLKVLIENIISRKRRVAQRLVSSLRLTDNVYPNGISTTGNTDGNADSNNQNIAQFSQSA